MQWLNLRLLSLINAYTFLLHFCKKKYFLKLFLSEGFLKFLVFPNDNHDQICPLSRILKNFAHNLIKSVASPAKRSLCPVRGFLTPCFLASGVLRHLQHTLSSERLLHRIFQSGREPLGYGA